MESCELQCRCFALRIAAEMQLRFYLSLIYNKTEVVRETIHATGCRLVINGRTLFTNQIPSFDSD